jgi:hypothetical protein
MDKVKFLATMDSLAEIYGKELRPKMAEEYFKILSRFENWQFERICAQAKLELDTFPKVSQLLKVAEAAGYIKVSKMDSDAYMRFLVVECICEGTYAVDRRMILDNPQIMFRCHDPACQHMISGKEVLAGEQAGFYGKSTYWDPLFRKGKPWTNLRILKSEPEPEIF